MEPYDANVKFTEQSDEMEPEWGGKSKDHLSVWEGRRMLVWVGGGLLIVLIVILVLVVGGAIRRPAVDNARLSQEVSQFEKNLQDLARIVRSQGEQIARLEKSQEKIAQETANLSSHMGRMLGEILAAVQKNASARPATASAPPPVAPAPAATPQPAPPKPQTATAKQPAASPKQPTAPPKQPPPPARQPTETRYHVVTAKETLYSIAKKYGLSPADLMRINKLDKGEAIHPGQKLQVSPAVSR